MYNVQFYQNLREFYRENRLHNENCSKQISSDLMVQIDFLQKPKKSGSSFIFAVILYLFGRLNTKTALPSFTNTNDTLTNRSLWPCTIDNAQPNVCTFFFSFVARFSRRSLFGRAITHSTYANVERLLLHHSSPFVQNFVHLELAVCVCVCMYEQHARVKIPTHKLLLALDSHSCTYIKLRVLDDFSKWQLIFFGPFSCT